MTGCPVFAASSAQSTIAVSCGTPTPATMRVVQIEPGPMPTFTASAPASISARVASAVATLPATIWTRFESRFRRSTASATPLEWPWAVSITTTSTPASTSATERSKPASPDRRGGGDQQPPVVVLGGVRVQHRLLDVLEGQQPGQPPAVVDDEQLLDLPLLQHPLGLAEIGRLAQHREVLARHHRRDRRAVVAGEAHVAVGDDADHDARRRPPPGSR